MFKKIMFVVLSISTPINLYATELMTGQQSLEFHGYIRTGAGMSQGGNTQAKFQAPGARSKYRLGNEPETSLELQLSYRYDLNAPEYKNSFIEGIFMLDAFQTFGNSSDLEVGRVAQAYLNFNKFFNNDVKVWLGRRYYDRKSIHIMNHYWMNPGQNSQTGVGFEDMSIGAGKLKLALFRYEDAFTDSGTSYLINSTRLDARLHNLNLADNLKLTIWAGMSERHKLASLNYDAKSGYGLGGWMDYKAKKLTNTTVLLYQTGSQITQGDFNPNSIRENQGWNLDEAESFEISNALTYQSLPDYSFQWSLAYRQEDRGTAGNSKVDWYSTGIRPIFYFSKHLNLALEAGVDYVDDKVNDRKGELIKFTTALQISADRGLFSRPVLRFFVTVADWSDEFKGLIGNGPGSAPYGDKTEGWTIGAQAEVWW